MDKRYRITREEAIQILSTRDAHGVLCGYTSGVTEALDMAIEALKEQEISNELQEYAYECGYEHFFHECQSCEYRRIGNKAQDWIPISERLPHDQELVNVTVVDDHGDNEWRYTTTAWRSYDMWISDNELVMGTVVAWAPLPKPYERDKL